MVVSNSSPLIAGLDIGLGAVFEALFGEVYIPPAVRQEVFTSRPQPPWIIEHPLSNPHASGLLQGRLGAGEREAIALTLEVNAELLLMDELAGRRTATSLGLRVMGTLGVLLRAKTQQLISAACPNGRLGNNCTLSTSIGGAGCATLLHNPISWQHVCAPRSPLQRRAAQQGHVGTMKAGG